MRKKIGIIKLRISPGKATPAPPIGPALGQKGINIMDFCKKFNSQTSNFFDSETLPVVIFYYSDKTYSFLIKKPTITLLLKKKLNLDRFIKNDEKKVFVDILILIDITKIKYTDFNTSNLYSCLKIVIGTIKSIGLYIDYKNVDKNSNKF